MTRKTAHNNDEEAKAENPDAALSSQANSPLNEQAMLGDGETKPAAESQAPTDGETAKASKQETASLEAEVAELKDKLLRAMAEAENVRRRAERDKENAAKYAVTNFAREMIRVHDNLRRALGSIDEQARKESETMENLLAGIELTEREMLNSLERSGIKPIIAMGQKFDPDLHEAILEIEDQTQPVGTVVHVMEQGYIIHDRPLRPARVGISKGGQAAANGDAGNEKKTTSSLAKGQAAYEKQADAQSESAGLQLDEEL